MKTFFILISLALKVVSGLKMCIGPHEPPEIANIITTPVYDDKNRLIEADVTIEVISSVPVYIQWKMSYGASVMSFTLASEGLDQLIRELIRAQEQHMKLPTITEMPHIQNVIDEIGLNEIRVGFSYGPESEAPLVRYGGCNTISSRTNDTLRDVYYVSDEFNSTNIVLENLGIAETTCIPANFHKGLQSYYVSFSGMVRSERPNGVFYYVNIYTGFQRNDGVKRPAIAVTDIWRNSVITPDGVPVIFTKKDETLISCFAEAARKPYTAVARIGRGGNYQLLQASPRPFPNFLETLSAADFAVKSPKLAEEDEYICSAASGEDVVNQRFKVMRHEPVHIERNEPAGEVTKDQVEQEYNFTCEATGVPQPKITFSYMTSKFHPVWVGYVEEAKEHEIHDSDLFETTTRVEGTRTLGEIKLEDTRKIIEALPSGYWDDNDFYALTCVAYNDFTIDSSVLLTITK